MKTEEIFEVLLKDINDCEQRQLIKKSDGTYREETDDEFRNRLIKKYESEQE